MTQAPRAQSRETPAASTARMLPGAALVLLICAWTTGLLDRLVPRLGVEGFVAIALGLSVVIALAPGPARSPVPRWAWLRLLVAIGAGTALVLLGLWHGGLQLRIARPDPGMLLLSAAALVAVIAATWRRMGPALPMLLVLLAIFCLAIGPDLPGRFATRALEPARMIAYLGLDTNGLFSRLTYIAAATIAPFVLFGALFATSGAGRALTEPLQYVLRDCNGGAAKAAVLGSAGFGMISGSAVANVTTSGPVTIPLMIDDGMSPSEASAIEAVASTYGQLMPPIMGASAFLMAEWLGLPYTEVALAALAPSLLAFLSLILWIDFTARARPQPSARERVRGRPRLDAGTLALAILPFAALAYALFVSGMAPGRAALVGCAVIALVRLLGAERGRPGEALRALAAGVMASVPGIVGVLLLGASAALLMGLLNVSGAGFMVTVRLIDLAQGNFALLAAMTALLAILLGLGMPTAGVYLVAAGLCAPALAAAGADPLAAHIFILIFGLLSMITPPVALASYAAATLSGAGTWQTGRAAFRMGIGMAVVGAAILIEPALLRPQPDARFMIAFVSVALALVMLTAGHVGHLARPLGVPARGLAVLLAGLLLSALRLPETSALPMIAILSTAVFAWRYMRGETGAAPPLAEVAPDNRP